MSLDTGPENFSHQVEYNVDLRTNGTLNDTSLLFPYPEDEKFHQAIENDSAQNVSIANDFNASTSITGSGYLKLDVGDFRPQTKNERYSSERINITPEENEELRRNNLTGIREYSSYEFIVQIDYNRSIDTREGLTNEPHLSSNTAECRNARESGCASTEAFLSYETGDDTYLEADVNIVGRNTWNEGFSWQGNEYRQNFYNSYYENDYLKGSQDNWVELFGREEQGDGVYRRD